MDQTLHRAELGELPLDETEILRYAQLPRFAGIPDALPLEECLEMVRGRVRCRAVWRQYPLAVVDDGLDLGFAVTGSVSLARHLAGCGGVLLFCCTAGAEMDRLIARGQLRSPLHGLLLHAIGAQQVEAACDRLCGQLARACPDCALTPRFSPGYGDLPLVLQKPIFAALDCERQIGVTLTDSLLMRPSKSVTAVVGIRITPPATLRSAGTRPSRQSAKK